MVRRAAQEDFPGDLRGLGLDSHSLFFETLFRKGFGSDLFDLGWILGGFWSPKWRPKSIFGRFFGDVVFERILAPIFGSFLEAPNPENMHGA